MLNTDAQTFIKHAAGKPFVIEVATFAPHAPYTPAPRNANDFPGLQEPRDPSFDTNNINPPAWLGARPPLTAQQIRRLDTSYRKRAQAVEAVDKLLADTEATLAAEHLTDNTYIVFSSDNGYHLGQHRLLRGQADRVRHRHPRAADRRRARSTRRPDGPRRSCRTPTCTRRSWSSRRHARPAGRRAQPGTAAAPGRQRRAVARPSRWSSTTAATQTRPTPTSRAAAATRRRYEAIRISAPSPAGVQWPGRERLRRVRRSPQHEIEYYDIAQDPFEQHNVAADLTAAQRTELHGIITGMKACHTGAACRSAARPT